MTEAECVEHLRACIPWAAQSSPIDPTSVAPGRPRLNRVLVMTREDWWEHGGPGSLPPPIWQFPFESSSLRRAIYENWTLDHLHVNMNSV